MPERIFDRVYKYDPRSARYPVRRLWGARAQPPLRSHTWNVHLDLDQGSEGACVGFGFTHEAGAEPEAVTGLDNEYAFDWYRRAKRNDEWEGEDYSGTSVNAGAKVGVQLGHYASYLWAQFEEDIARVVGTYGPVVIGVNWYEGMFNTDPNGFIWPTGDVLGGHCVVIIGVNIEEGYYILKNSWGRSWGVAGTAKLHRENMARLLDEQGDACVVTRVHIGPDPEPEPEPVPPKPVCNFWCRVWCWLTGRDC